MLAISWMYMIHNLIMTYIAVGILKQLFFIKTDYIRNLKFVAWIQLVFIFNDFVVQEIFPLEYKYICIFIGFSLGIRFILKLPTIATVLVMILNLTINGIATNINIMTLVMVQFNSYGIALEHDFVQYTSLVMVTLMQFLIIKTFNIRILDISRYN